MKLKRFLLFLLSCTGMFANAQSTYSLALTSDTLFWDIPGLNAKSFLLFSALDGVDKFNIQLSDKPLTLLLGKEHLLSLSADDVNQKKVYPVKLSLNGQHKSLMVIYKPPFKSAFSKRYKKQNGAVIIENAPVYELVNIAYAITDAGSKDGITFNLHTPYFKEVVQHFAPYKEHPLIKSLNKNYQQFDAGYRMCRESAYNYSFNGYKIIVSGPYENFEEGNTVLDDLALWEDFAKQSDFQKFYKTHGPYYIAQCNASASYLPVKQMWKWCEERFTNKYQTYRIVISPLIEGFHSTQYINSKDFNECIMFISAIGNFGNNRPKQEVESLYSGIVFTEIDHNYINPVSDLFAKELDTAFSAKRWAKGTQAEGYGSGKGVFNEYITHALYLLYIKDLYAPKELALVENSRTALMLQRGFPLFKEFYLYLSGLYQRPEYKKNIAAMYPQLIAWGNEKSK